MKEAFHVCQSGRPGPVIVDMPKDIQLDDLSELEMDPCGIAQLTLDANCPGRRDQ